METRKEYFTHLQNSYSNKFLVFKKNDGDFLETFSKKLRYWRKIIVFYFRKESLTLRSHFFKCENCDFKRFSHFRISLIDPNRPFFTHTWRVFGESVEKLFYFSLKLKLFCFSIGIRDSTPPLHTDLE